MLTCELSPCADRLVLSSCGRCCPADAITSICGCTIKCLKLQVLFAYINLLKTISMKLTPGIVGLFFHADDGEGASFPLYTEAVKFISHRCAPVNHPAGFRLMSTCFGGFMCTKERVAPFLPEHEGHQFHVSGLVIDGQPAHLYVRKDLSLLFYRCKLTGQSLHSHSSFDGISPQGGPSAGGGAHADAESLRGGGAGGAGLPGGLRRRGLLHRPGRPHDRTLPGGCLSILLLHMEGCIRHVADPRAADWSHRSGLQNNMSSSGQRLSCT